MPMKINLFINFYTDSNAERQKELDLCLSKNKANGYIDNIIIAEGVRPTYNQFFSMTRDYPEDINIIANTDIYFDESLALLKDWKWGQNTCFALSRWDVNESGEAILWEHPDSQDSWIFYGGVKKHIPFADFTLGVPGCDNAIADRLSQGGYQVLNPAKTIKSMHVHLTNKRNYLDDKGHLTTQRVPLPYKILPLITLDQIR